MQHSRTNALGSPNRTAGQFTELPTQGAYLAATSLPALRQCPEKVTTVGGQESGINRRIRI